MNDAKLRAWWWHRQGLDGSLIATKPAEILARAGWARSVGGVGPYLTFFARAGIERARADEALANLEIHELPAARGCTYVLPAADYALGLLVAQPFAGTEQKTATKLGVTNKEIDKLCQTILRVLTDQPLDPDTIKKMAGKAVRNLGEEGKKKGLTTTLPVALGLLQSRGEIRRVPINGRLDQQRYKYVRWAKNPLFAVERTQAQANAALAAKYLRWVGPATMKELQWFCGFGVKACKEAIFGLQLEKIGQSDRCLVADDVPAFERFEVPSEPNYALVSSLDAISAARRNVATLVDDNDRDTVTQLSLGDTTKGALTDLIAHAIFDRGRLIGYWEYDSDEARVVWMTFNRKLKKDLALRQKVEQTETYIRDHLGDARSFSLDSPKSRMPKIAAIRHLA